MWIVKEDGYRLDNINRGNKMLLANGYMGFRGLLDEDGAEQLVALNIGGLYDQVEDNWAETVNAPNPLRIQLFVDGMALSQCSVISHTQSLDIRNAVFARKTVFSTGAKNITVESQRFLQEDYYTNINSRIIVSCDATATIKLNCGIDANIWDISGKHLTNMQFECNDCIECCSLTSRDKRTVKVALYTESNLDFAGFASQEQSAYYCFEKEVQPNKQYFADRFATVCVDEHDTGYRLSRSTKVGFDQLLAEHMAYWQEKWNIADVIMEGDDDAQFALRYSIYHLLILSPKTDISISARGLSGQTYKGAVFWDTEMFLLPFYTAIAPSTAEKLVAYRIAGLDGAKEKAREYGYDGAFYAWESQDKGKEACSDFNVVDVFTNRKVRTYFKDKQIHISGDVAIACYRLYACTKNLKLLIDGGLEMLLECAKFYMSYAYYNENKDRYELLDVMGPDEYHERVNNNAYTNYIAYYTTLYALDALRIVTKRHSAKQCYIEDTLLQRLKRFAKKLYLPTPNHEAIIEQFDGYFRHEDVTVGQVAARLVNEREYWGGSGGVATATRVIKQADVVALMAVYGELFDVATMEHNWKYYLPYTEHGSSLSASMYAQVACKIGLVDQAYGWFVKSASVDLKGDSKQYAGNVYIGGTHPASCGGAWQNVVMGFGGLGYDGNGIVVRPNLPSHITRIVYKVYDRRKLKQVEVTRDDVIMTEI